MLLRRDDLFRCAGFVVYACEIGADTLPSGVCLLSALTFLQGGISAANGYVRVGKMVYRPRRDTGNIN